MSLSNEEYVAKGGHHCPHCGSTYRTGITAGNVEIEAGRAWQEVTCGDCKASWNDLYQLTGYVTTEAPPGALDAGIAYSVCDDCLLVISHGISDTAPDEHDQAFDAGVKRELGERTGHFCAGVPPTEDDPDGRGFDEFSSHECELCRTHLAGARHGVTLLFTDEEPTA